ncbi:NAD(P)/FAD-dependent oxidoreductase [Spongiivirga citrea]|uniref:FAD-dependent oxidoreductase n=1 Tax=Spongiivirga citrea TaxID=1481457 RepID=A0A6M0CN49_9FLAO|nr:FAD-dependent oxidoreductase [Spongiivirga citrea]NER19112.1 FAD-dependent oxidoreductase [Spongiivirga citrea]
MNKTNMENVLVIGGGLMGASAAWKLAERGAKVTLIEQQEPNYSKGSSYGSARITRSLGAKKDVFSYVHNQTIKEVSNLIDFLNAEEKTQVHTMGDVYTTSPVTYLHPKEDYLKVNKYRFKKQKNDYSRASQNSSFRKFGMTIPKNTFLVREKREYSGSLNPTVLIDKLRQGVTKKGGVIKYQHQVVGLKKNDDVFEVDILNLKTKNNQKLKISKVVVAAGAYTTEILKDFAPYLNRILTPKKIALSFLRIKDECYQELNEASKQALQNGFPFFSQIGKEYFAIISESKNGASPIIKAGGHQKRRNIHDLDKIWEEAPTKQEKKWIKKQFKNHLKMLEIHLSNKDIEEVESYNCVYSETRTQIPIVTPIFNKYRSLDREIVIIGGMSGIGAKGCLSYGLLATDLLLGKDEKPTNMYRKMTRTFSNPSVSLYAKRKKSGRLF